MPPPSSSHQRYGMQSFQARKFVMLTPDAWNYRLMEVTKVDSAETFRSLICYNLGISDANDIQISVTSPGQLEHKETLEDGFLMQLLQLADASANLKIFVRSPQSIAASAGHGTDFVNSPFLPMHDKLTAGRKPIDEATYAKLISADPGEGAASPAGRRLGAG
ncbi:hypothetical protein MRB53_041790 [Persea americana]|nr:hypothetical protein MRB53_041790 [Persea americana]